MVTHSTVKRKNLAVIILINLFQFMKEKERFVSQLSKSALEKNAELVRKNLVRNLIFKAKYSQKYFVLIIALQNLRVMLL